MKGKMISVGAAALLAMAFLGCSEQALEEDAPEYDEQGRRLVQVSIPTRAYEQGGLRSLTGDIAQAAWDYIEVVFDLDADGNSTFGEANDAYYVGSAIKGNAIKLALPVGDYQAVMFAGVANGTKLLAVGVVTSVDGTGGSATPTAGTLTLAADTKTIVFILSALTTDIDPNPATPTAGSFAITAPTSPTDYTRDVPTGHYLVDGKEAPYFSLPANNSAITGTFTIGGFDVPDIANLLDTSLAAEQLFGVIGAATDFISSIGVSAYNQTTGLFLTPVSVTGEITAAEIDASDNLELTFELTTPATDGLTDGFSKLRFDVPIQAFNASGAEVLGRGGVWHIVNGLEAAALDLGAGASATPKTNSTGQNILLAIGADPEGQTIPAPTL